MSAYARNYAFVVKVNEPNHEIKPTISAETLKEWMQDVAPYLRKEDVEILRQNGKL